MANHKSGALAGASSQSQRESGEAAGQQNQSDCGLLDFEGASAMTFEMVDGAGVVRCDTCPDEIETGMDNFKDTMIEARRRGWRSYIGPDKEWAHSCPSCVEDFAKSRNR